MPVESRRKALIQENQSRRWGDRVQPRPHTGITHSLSNNQSYPSPSPSATPSPSSLQEERLTPPAVDHSREGNHNSDLGNDIGFLPTDATTTVTGSGRPFAMTSTLGWSLDFLLGYSSNFVAAERISATSHDLAKTMKEFEHRGEPLVVESYNNHPKWPHEMFTLDYFMEHGVSNEISVRNVHDWTDRTMNLADFVEKCRSAGYHATADEEVRLYGKDTECPKPWEHWLKNGGVIPSSLVGNGPQDLFRYRPESASVQTLMCYLGIGDTFTPCHKDLCASSGQNLMCYTEDGGASFWFMTRGSSSVDAAKYFQKLGRELDHENYVINLEELAKAPFKIYIIKQKVGDLVLVPPRSCHQVVNFGGITVKTSWSRMTLEGLSTAYHQELPIYRRVCRPEIYRVKSTIHYALLTQTKELQSSISRKRGSSTSSSKLVVPKAFDVSNLKALLSLYDCILAEEYAPGNDNMHHVIAQQNGSDNEDHLSCDFCGGDIFQSFFDCGKCTEDENHLHICPGCFVEGRHCKCQHMRSVQYRNFKELVEIRDRAENVIRQYEEQRGRMFRQELALQNASVPPLFRAACYLNKIRKNTKWSCTLPTPHACWLECVLHCKQCHGGRCFPYITGRWHVHSSQALIAHSSDKTHSTYHKTHLQGKKRFQEDEYTLEQSQKLGARHQGYSLLLHNALNFVQCNPLNPRFLTRGWYDTKYEHQILEDQVTDDGKEERRASGDVSPSSSVLVQDVVVQAPEISQPDGDSDQMAVDIVKPIKRKPSFYIDVPRAPYSTRRALSGCIGQSSARDPAKGTNDLESSGPSDQRHRKGSLRGPAVERSTTSPLLTSGSTFIIAAGPNNNALQRTPESDMPVVPGSDKATKKRPLTSLRFKKRADAGCGETSSALSLGTSQEGHWEVVDDHVESNTSSSTDPSPSAFPASNTHRPPSHHTTSSTANSVPSTMPGPFTSSNAASPVSQMQEPMFLRQMVTRAMHHVGVVLQNAAQAMLPQAFEQNHADTRSDLLQAHPPMPMSLDSLSGNSDQARHTTPRNSVFRPEASSMQYGMQGSGSHPASKRRYAQASWNEGPSTPPNYHAQNYHNNNGRSYEYGHNARPPYHRRQSYNDEYKYKHPRNSYHTRPLRSGHPPLKRNYSDETRYRHDRPLSGQYSDVDVLPKWTSSPYRRPSPRRSEQPFDTTTYPHPHDESPRARHSATRYGTWQGRRTRFDTPLRPHYADGSQRFDTAYNEQYMYHRDRWEQDNITIMDLTPSLPNEEVAGEPTRESAGPSANPFYQEDSRRDFSSMSYFQGNSQTPNHFISNLEMREVLDRPASSSEASPEARNDMSRTAPAPTIEDPHAKSNEDRSVNAGHVPETRALTEDQQWEDGYDQSGEEEFFPHQQFRHAVISHTNDEDNISLGPEEDELTNELTRNNWV